MSGQPFKSLRKNKPTLNESRSLRKQGKSILDEEDLDDESEDDMFSEEEAAAFAEPANGFLDSEDSDDEEEESRENPEPDDSGEDEPEEDAGMESQDDSGDKEAGLYKLGDSRQDRTRLPEGKTLAKIEGVRAEAACGTFGDYVRVLLYLKARNKHTKQIVSINFVASKTSTRLKNFVTDVLDHVPAKSFDLRKLVGYQVYIEVEHRPNSKGQIWDEIVSTEHYSPKSKLFED